MSGNPLIQQAYQSILEHDFEQAIEWFQQAVRVEPNNAEIHYKLSITYARSNKLVEALEHSRIAVQLEPEQFIYVYHYRNIRARELVQEASRSMEQGTGDLNLAAAMLKQAIQLDALYLDAYVMLAVAYSGLKRFALAADTLREALKLDPNRVDAKVLLQQVEPDE